MKKSDIVKKVIFSNQHQVSHKYIQMIERGEGSLMVDPLISNTIMQMEEGSYFPSFYEQLAKSSEITQDGRIILLLSC